MALTTNIWNEFIDRIITPDEANGYTMVVWPVEGVENDARLDVFLQTGARLNFADAIPIRDLPGRVGIDATTITSVSFDMQLPTALHILFDADRRVKYPMTFVCKPSQY